MPTTNEKVVNENVTDEDLLIAGNTLNQNTDPGLSKVLTEYLLGKITKERQAEEAVLERRRQAHLDRCRETAAERQAIANRQAACSHRKPAPSLAPAIGGQRSHQNRYHYLCQYCGKHWVDDELPYELRGFDHDIIGGPMA